MEGDLFLSGLSGYAPLASRGPHYPLTGFEGVPGFSGHGVTSLAMQLLAGPALQRMMGAAGMTPGGLLHDQNVYDVLQNRWFTQAYRSSLRDAAQADRESYLRAFGGLAALTGTPFGARQRDAAGSLADAAVSLTPLLAEAAPDFADQLGGSRGLASVMAYRMATGGRYRFDPATGLYDPSGSAAAAQARPLFSQLYEPFDLRATQGFSAGQMGAAYEQLAMRGMLPGTGGPSALLRAVTEAKPGLALQPGGAAGLSPSDLEKLRLDPAVADRLKSIDMEGVKRTLRGYTDALSAVRDLFGDMGRSNAPMSELFGALEALSNGGLARMAPDQLAATVRQTRELTKLTGVGVDAAAAVQAHASSRAAQLGMDPVFGVQGMQAALAFGGAYTASGQSAHAAWGRFNGDQQTMLAANRAVQAAGSRLAEQMAAAGVLSEQGGGFAAGTDAARYAEAVRSGADRWTDSAGRARRFDVPREEFVRMMAQGSPSLTEGMVAQALGNRDALAEYSARERLGERVMGLQGEYEVRPWLQTQYRRALADVFAQRVGRDQAEAAASRAAGLAADAVLGGVDAAAFADPARRAGAMAAAVRGAVRGTALDDERFLAAAAGLAYGSVDEQVKRSSYAAYANQQNLRAQFDPETVAAARRVSGQARDEGAVAGLLAPLGRGGLGRRLVQAVMSATPGSADLGVALSEAVGGVRSADVRAALRDAGSGLSEELKGLRDAQAALRSAPAEGRAAAEADLRRREASVRTRVDALKKREELAGEPAALSPEDAAAALQGARTGASFSEALAKVRGSEDPGKAFAAFWKTPSGAAARDTFTRSLADLDAVAAYSVTREGLRAYGASAAGQASRVAELRGEFSDLARLHAGGDVARLMAGDLDVDRSTDAGRKEYDRVFGRVKSLAASQQELARYYADGALKRGGGWDAKADARKVLGAGAKGADVDRLAGELSVAGAMSDEDHRRADRYRALKSSLDAEKDPERRKAIQAQMAGLHAELGRSVVAASVGGAAGAGAGADAMVAASAAVDRLEAAAGAGASVYAGPASRLVDQAFSAAGLGDLAGERAGKVAGEGVRTRADRERVAGITKGFRDLRGLVDAGGGMSDAAARSQMKRLLDDYEVASADGGDKAMAGLRSVWGLDDAKFARLEKDARVLRATGAARALVGSADARAEALEAAVSGTASPQVEISGTLKLDVENSTASVKGAMTGGRDAKVR